MCVCVCAITVKINFISMFPNSNFHRNVYKILISLHCVLGMKAEKNLLKEIIPKRNYCVIQYLVCSNKINCMKINVYISTAPYGILLEEITFVRLIKILHILGGHCSFHQNSMAGHNYNMDYPRSAVQ